MNDDHDILAVLLVNLGTPAAPTTTAIKTYLAEFLSDPCVVGLPRWLWLPILHGIILRCRPKRSALLYKKIWLPEGSPLLVYSQNLANKLQNQLQQHDQAAKVLLGMRYGQPSLNSAFAQLKTLNLRRLIVLPLYPQYAEASTGSSILRCHELAISLENCLSRHFITDYYENKGYISAISQQIERYRQHDYLIFSFHGIPRKCIDRGSPYYQHCLTTAQLIADKLRLKSNQWEIAFQSRFGPSQWLQPYCDQVLKNLAAQGMKTIDIVCPGFAVDCLETLEEIAQGYQKLFQQAGGQSLNYIPALNDSDEHAAFLANYVRQYIS